MTDTVLAFWLQHAPVLSVLLPTFTAIAMLLLGEPDGASAQASGHVSLAVRRRRWLAMASVLLGAVMAAGLVWRASSGELLVYQLGEWPAPFGIVLVVDRLSALMVLLTYSVAVPALWYATGGWDCRGRHFHALFQFQLMGLCGAFLTGDLFNLFVFFEVLLIASYVLLVHGQGRERFRMGVHYVVLNLAASGLFLIGVAMLYAVTGTLNMADLGQRVALLQGDAAFIARASALVLLVVFGLKAAMVPLYFWLPATYAAASAPVAALFAIMTKVGVYSIIRVHWGIFGAGAGEAALAAQDWLLPLALTTSVLGVLGALAAHSLGRMVAYLTVSSVGTILAGVGLFTPATLSAALYYTLHSTVVIAGLFLLVGFFTIVGLARAGVVVFWHVQPEEHADAQGSGSSPKLLTATWALMVITLAMAVLAAPVKRYTDDAANQLADTSAYVRAVLGSDAAGRSTTRPFDGRRAEPAPTQETPR